MIIIKDGGFKQLEFPVSSKLLVTARTVRERTVWHLSFTNTHMPSPMLPNVLYCKDFSDVKLIWKGGLYSENELWQVIEKQESQIRLLSQQTDKQMLAESNNYDLRNGDISNFRENGAHVNSNNPLYDSALYSDNRGVGSRSSMTAVSNNEISLVNSNADNQRISENDERDYDNDVDEKDLDSTVEDPDSCANASSEDVSRFSDVTLSALSLNVRSR